MNYWYYLQIVGRIWLCENGIVLIELVLNSDTSSHFTDSKRMIIVKLNY